MTYRKETHHPWLKDFSFEDVTSPMLLKSVCEYKDLERRAWILDLDSTLFCVEPRTRRIFLEFLTSRSYNYQEWWTIYSLMKPESQSYNIQELFTDLYHGIDSQNANQKAKELWREFESYWMSRFFQGRYMFHDVPYPGAVGFVKQIVSSGDHVIYLTGRQYKSSFGESLKILKRHDFPVSPQATLVLKSDHWAHLSDFEYKDKVCSFIKNQWNVVCCIDNEPENLIAYAKNFKNADLVLFHSVMSKRRPSMIDEYYLKNRKLLKLESFNS